MSDLVGMKEQLRAKEAVSPNGNLNLFLLTGLIVSIFALRFFGITENTIFYDEAVNVILGTEILAGNYAQQSSTWTFGSDIFPIIAALSNHLASEIGLRALVALLNTGTILFVFLSTRNLFNFRAGLWTMAILGILASSINLGQVAVYDSLGVFTLTIALYLITESVKYHGSKQNIRLALVGFFAGISVLSKYIAILFLPALGLSSLVIFQYYQRELRPLFTISLSITVIIICWYGITYLDDITYLYSNQGTLLRVEGSRASIIQTIWVELGIVFALASIGAISLLIQIHRSNRYTVKPLLLFSMSILLLILLTLLVPIYHIVSANIQSLWKHTFYSAIFLAPFAGVAINQLSLWGLNSQRRSTFVIRILIMLVATIGLSQFINRSLDRNWGYVHSWPNVNNAVAFLETQEISSETRILAEQSAVYEYYLNPGGQERGIWSNTFYLEYRGSKGVEGMVKAIEDLYFDYVILDDYYTASSNMVLREALQRNSYSMAYHDSKPQELSTGQVITIEIYLIDRNNVEKYAYSTSPHSNLNLH